MSQNTPLGSECVPTTCRAARGGTGASGTGADASLALLVLELDEMATGTVAVHVLERHVVDGRRLNERGEKISGNTICALGDAAATPVESFIRHFRHEFEYYIKHGRSIVESEHNLIKVNSTKSRWFLLAL